MNELFQIPAEVSKVESMANRSLRLRIDSQESLTDEMMAKAMNKLGKIGWFTFSEEPIQPEEILNLPALTFEKNEKSKSLRLRNTLFCLWKQLYEKKLTSYTSEEFYQIKMEAIINSIKEKLV